MNAAICYKVKKIRELNNFTQEYVANLLGMSQSNYARIESGAVALSKKKLQRIAEIFNCSPELIEGFPEGLPKMVDVMTKSTPDINLIQGIKMLQDELQRLSNRVEVLETELIATRAKYRH